MSHASLQSLTRGLESLLEGNSVAGLSDRQLLERFTTRRETVDDLAFAAMVSRHGPMVLGVRRQFLGDQHLAEDAFQAVFLVLAQARSIRDPDMLGNWLHGVACRTARFPWADRSLAADRGRGCRQTGEGSSYGGGRGGRVRGSRPRRFISRSTACQATFANRSCCATSRVSPSTRRQTSCGQRVRCAAGWRGREKLRRGLTRRGFALTPTGLAAILSTRSLSAAPHRLRRHDQRGHPLGDRSRRGLRDARPGIGACRRRLSQRAPPKDQADFGLAVVLRIRRRERRMVCARW